MKKFNLEENKYFKPIRKNKVIGLAYNYKSLVDKKNNFDEPLIFLKSNTSIIFNNQNIILPKNFKKTWIEAELCIIVKKEAKNVPASKAKDYIFGFTCGNDVTSENIYNRDWHLARSKALDTFAPLGPNLVSNIDTTNLKIKSFINGKITQNSFTNDRILNDYECLELVSKYMTLYPGDIIFTGTPAGATDAIIKVGDEVIIEIENVGKLMNKVSN